MLSRRWSVVVALLVPAAVAAAFLGLLHGGRGAVAPKGSSPAVSQAGVLHVAPGASGRSCSAQDPCGSLADASRRSGHLVLVREGRYPRQDLSTRSPTGRLAVRPAGGPVVLDGLSVSVGGLSFHDLRVEGDVELSAGADAAHLEDLVVRGGVRVSGASGVVLRRVKAAPPCCNRNALVVGGSDPGRAGNVVPRAVLVEESEFGPAWASPDWKALGVHNESVHISAVDGLVFRGNVVHEGGTTASLHVASDTGPVAGVRVEDTVVVGCGFRSPPAGARCDAYHAFSTGAAEAAEVEVVRSTVLGTLLLYVPEVVRYRGVLTTGGVHVCDPVSTSCRRRPDRCDTSFPFRTPAAAGCGAARVRGAADLLAPA